MWELAWMGVWTAPTLTLLGHPHPPVARAPGTLSRRSGEGFNAP
jgi:hypothetical protein